MELSKATRIVIIISAVVLILGLATLEAFTDFDAAEWIRLIQGVIAGFGSGLFLAGGPSRGNAAPGAGGAGAAAVVLLLASVGLCGCSAAQRVDEDSCSIEQQVVAAIGVGLDATDALVGDQGGEHYSTAMTAARGAQELGQQAVAACELARDGAAWQQWVALAIEAIGAVVGVVEGAGPADIAGPAPPELHRALELLETEARL